MKRLIAVIVLVVVVIGSAVVALPFLVSSESVRARIIEQAETLTGRQMSFRAAPKVFFNPYLGIAIDSVIFEGPKRRPEDPPLVEMEELRGRVAILPALLGRVEITQYEFVRPRFNLRVFDDGHASWAFPGGEVWQLLDRARAARQATEPNAKVDLTGIDSLKIGRFQVVDGTIAYENEQTGASELLTNVNASLNWPESTSSWTIDGATIWRDEALDFSIRTSQPLLLMAGGTSSASATIKSGAFQFTFSGDADMLASLHLAGSASLSAPSIPRLVNLFGGDMETGSTAGQFSASGDVKGTLKQVQLTEAELSFDGNKGRGVLQLTRGGERPQINATLAFRSFDFTPYLASLRQEAEINRPGLAGLQLLERVDTDIRLSAGEARLGKLAIGNLAGALSLRNGELSFELGNGDLYGGVAMGSLTISKTENGVAFDSEASLSGAQLSPALDALYPAGVVKLNTVGEVKLNAKSNGTSVREVVDGLSGWVTLKTGKGTMTGADLDRLLQAGTEEDDTAVLRLSGNTSFDALDGNFLFDQGAVWVRGIELTSKALIARLTGRADLASGGLALRVRLAEASATGAGREARLFVGGVASSPLVTRDPRAAGSTAQ